MRNGKTEHQRLQVQVWSSLIRVTAFKAHPSVNLNLIKLYSTPNVKEKVLQNLLSNISLMICGSRSSGAERGLKGRHCLTEGEQFIQSVWQNGTKIRNANFRENINCNNRNMETQGVCEKTLWRRKTETINTVRGDQGSGNKWDHSRKK